MKTPHILFSSLQMRLMMLYGGQAGQTTCTAAKVSVRRPSGVLMYVVRQCVLIWTVTLSTSWWPVFSSGTLKRSIKCLAVGPAIARVFFGWRLVCLLAQTNVLNFFSLSLLLSVALFLSISQALLQWCLRTCPRTLNRLGLSPVSSSNALPRAHACVQKHFTFMHLASAFAVCFYFIFFVFVVLQ